MSEFIEAMWPVVLLWTIPLFPMIYAGIAGTVEWLGSSSAQGLRRVGGRTESVRLAARARVRTQPEVCPDAPLPHWRHSPR